MELDKLENQLTNLRKDKETTEDLLKIPQDSFARVLDKASSGAQLKGLIFGFVLGIIASLIAAWIWDLSHQPTLNPGKSSSNSTTVSTQIFDIANFRWRS